MPRAKPGSIDRAVSKLIRAAQAGAAEAALELGDRYREGNGVEESETQALHWYAVGAKLGDAEAQNNLGTMLLNGIGCEADAEAAVPWYRASAEQGNPVAQFNLGLRYLHGSGVEPDDRGLGGEKNPALCWAWIRWAHDGCPPMPEDETRTEELDAQVAEALSRFQLALDPAVRARGETLFSELQCKHGPA